MRTYVHRDGKEPGVWFFSLEADNALAVQVARKYFGLPYHRAEMRINKKEPKVYHSVRRQGQATHNIDVSVGGELPPPQPGSLEFFLVERYLLYAVLNGQLVTGRVYHEPYRVFEATVGKCDQTLMQVNGLPAHPWEHVCYSPGVDVEVFAIKKGMGY